MKTNASAKIIRQALENVSRTQFDRNLVFRTPPQKVTKNVSRFTIKTLRADRAGSLTNKLGVTMTKANWEAHEAVLNEMLRLDSRPHIYVDTVYGRQYAQNNPQQSAAYGSGSLNSDDNQDQDQGQDNNNDDDQTETRVKRKYRKRLLPISDIKNNIEIMNIVNAIRYIVSNPSILSVK